MLVANILCPLLILAFSVCIYFGFYKDNPFYFIGYYGWLAMISIFTLTWGWTLFKLYRDTVHSKKLLPNKKIFILHGSLLVLFVLLEVLEFYAYPRVIRASTPKGVDDWWGIYDCSVFLVNFVEALMFLVVLMLMLIVR